MRTDFLLHNTFNIVKRQFELCEAGLPGIFYPLKQVWKRPTTSICVSRGNSGCESFRRRIEVLHRVDHRRTRFQIGTQVLKIQIALSTLRDEETKQSPRTSWACPAAADEIKQEPIFQLSFMASPFEEWVRRVCVTYDAFAAAAADHANSKSLGGFGSNIKNGGRIQYQYHFDQLKFAGYV